jgi:arginine decarboxylase
MDVQQAFAPETVTGTVPGERVERELGIDIHIRTARGTGRTLLSAFDHALFGAGVADFNLVRLSSVIPQPSRLSFTSEPVRGEHGDRLYCVYAAAYAGQPGETAWAGLGWVRDDTGKGLFVEHTAGSEESLHELIHLSLEDMKASRKGGYGQVETAVVSAHHDGRPACALALATYQVTGWELT